jgi:hyperosmotically inducible periplasmic protein
LRRAVYRELFNSDSPLFRYGQQAVPPIHIIIKNGRLTLKGVVATESDSNLANLKARGVPGLFDVRNELRVENEG